MNPVLHAFVFGADDPPRGMTPVPEPDDLDGAGWQAVQEEAGIFALNFPRECAAIIRIYLRASGIKALCTSLEFGIARYSEGNARLAEENRKLREYMEAEVALAQYA